MSDLEFIGSKEIRTENDQNLTLQYSLVKDKEYVADSQLQPEERFGIQIDQIETDTVLAISNDRDSVLELAKKLMEGDVTPRCLGEICDEQISKWEMDAK